MRRGAIAVLALLLACGPVSVLPPLEETGPRKSPTAPPLAPAKGETVLAHEPVPFGEKILLPPEPEPPPDDGGLRELGVTKAETARPDVPAIPRREDLVALAPPSPPAPDAGPVERGAYLYFSHCATCHGAKGEGDGPSGAGLLYPPADLTRIAERRGGLFVPEDIAAHLDGSVSHPSHGSAEAPLWGPALDGDNSSWVVDHLARMQREELPREDEVPPESGEAGASDPRAGDRPAPGESDDARPPESETSPGDA